VRLTSELEHESDVQEDLVSHWLPNAVRPPPLVTVVVLTSNQSAGGFGISGGRSACLPSAGADSWRVIFNMGAMKQVMENASFLWRRDPRFVLFGLAGNQTSWRGLSLLALVFLGSLVLAAALLPFAYRAIESWDEGPNSQAAHLLLSRGANNFFDLLRWAPILVGLPWIMRACQL
jgi:hypothetical protein